MILIYIVIRRNRKAVGGVDADHCCIISPEVCKESPGDKRTTSNNKRERGSEQGGEGGGDKDSAERREERA